MIHNCNLGPIASDNSTLKNLLNPFPGNFNIGHVNAQSLCPSTSNTKLEEFKSTFCDSGLDVIGISETWYKPCMISQSLALPGYNLIRNDRPGDSNISSNCHPRRGGGVCLYIANNLSYKIVFRGKNYGQCESLFVEVFGNGGSILVGVVYLPNGCVDTFENLHSDLFDRFSNIVVMGDFNYNLFDPVKSINLRSLVSRCGLSVVHNNLPTHLSLPFNTTSLLDYFLLSQTSNLVFKGQLQFPFFSSHHSFVFISINFEPQFRQVLTEYKDYDKANFDSLCQQFNQMRILCPSLMNDVDSQLHNIDAIVENLHSLVPTYRSRPSVNIHIFMRSLAITRARKERDLAYGVYLRNRTSVNWRAYCRLRNKAKSIIRRIRRNYGGRLFSGCNNSQIWGKLRKLGCIGRETTQLNNSDIDIIATNFLSNMCPNNYGIFDIDNSVDNSDSFSFSPITEYDLFIAVNSIKSNAVGYDNIPIKFIKLILPLISPLLTHLINTIFTVSKFPSSWKVARVIPIAKNGQFDNNNLRPISILPAMSKIVENLMKQQILSHCNEFSLFHPNQFAYRINHNTTSLLLSMSDSVRKQLDKHKACILVSLDLTKAFDRLNHFILVRKLQEKFNFSKTACKLVYSYLLDRTQYVSHNGFNSNIGNVTSGVPQGSVLGPILFLAYLNDCINLMCNAFCQPYVFADDIFLLYTHHSEPSGSFDSCINDHLLSLTNWMHSNCLLINTTKTKALIFHSQNFNVPCPDIYINNLPINFVDSLKCLGVYLDSGLNFETHINTIANQICFILRRLYSLKAYTPRYVRNRLAHSLLMSRVNYGIEVFSGTWTYNRDKIERIVRKIVRYVFDVNIQEHDRVSELTPVLLGCNFQDYLNLRILLHFYKIMKLGKPELLAREFSFINSTRNIQISMPLIHLSVFEHSFLVRVGRIWNHLPSILRLFTYSYPTFRKKITEYFNNLLL